MSDSSRRKGFELLRNFWLRKTFRLSNSEDLVAVSDESLGSFSKSEM